MAHISKIHSDNRAILIRSSEILKIETKLNTGLLAQHAIEYHE